MVANWAACAPFLAEKAPALKHIVDEDLGPRRSTRDAVSAFRRDRAIGGPCHGYARPAWDRVRGLGAEEKEALPCDFAESTSQDFPVKGLQRTLSHLEHGRRYHQLYQAASPEVSAAMHSLSSPHAMIWHRVCPFEPRLQIASHLVKMRVRQELDLRMPCLTDAYNHQRIARCCNPHHAALEPRHAFDHLLCVTTANAGGSPRRTHDKLKFAVQAVCKAAGLSTFDEPVGEIHGIENPDGTTRGKQPDIRIVGLRQTGITVLVDTAVTHIMAQAKDHTSQPEPRQGKAAPTADPIAERNRAKDGKYKAAARTVNKEFIPLVMDTYGRMGKPFLNFLKDVAGHTANRASGNVNERTQAIYDSIEPPNELRNHVHLRNLALIHVALITSLMQRIAGSVVTNDRHHGARRGIYGAHEFYTQPNPVANPN